MFHVDGSKTANIRNTHLLFIYFYINKILFHEKNHLDDKKGI